MTVLCGLQAHLKLTTFSFKLFGRLLLALDDLKIRLRQLHDDPMNDRNRQAAVVAGYNLSGFAPASI